MGVATHCGRPKGEPNPAFSVKPIAAALSPLIDAEVQLADDCIGPQVKSAVTSMADGEVMLLENVRFHKGETKNDPEFAAQLAEASGATVYVNDAFGTAHRAHASTAGVTQFMEHSVAGFLVAKELDFLQKAVLLSPERPLVAIIGGAKVSTKIPVIKSLLRKCDTVVVVGGMTGTFYRAQGHNTGDSLVEPELVSMVKEFMEYADSNQVDLYLPTDMTIADEFSPDANTQVVPVEEMPDGWANLDIGPSSCEQLGKILAGARTVIWNGPPGMFEYAKFSQGTTFIAQTMAEITERNVITIVGGGDSVAAVNQLGLADKVSHVSTGGGAALELLEGLELPGIAALDDQ